MSRDAIDHLARSIRVSARRRHSIELELRAHLEDSRLDLQLSGLSPAEAARESMARLGDPQEIASQFDSLYRPNRRTQVGLALALATGMILGVYGIGGSLASATSQHHRTTTHAHVVHVKQK
jgi:hypothetical protein